MSHSISLTTPEDPTGPYTTPPDGLPPTDAPALERAADGDWIVRGHALARQLLRLPDGTRQAGFEAEALSNPLLERKPVLFSEGAEHHAYRTATARFFTPKTVDERYQQLIAATAEQLVGQLEQRGRADLSRLAMTMAVAVAAHVVGLTNSRRPGLDRRLEAFFARTPGGFGWRPDKLLGFLRTQWHMLRFYLLDVRPAIAARRRSGNADDVIGHLLQRGYREPEILIECITYAAAGMVTTREFLAVAAWHLLEDANLRARYLAADEAERTAILGEILRLEPVVGRLYRRAERDLQLEHDGETITIPAGSRIIFDVRAINTDARVVGAEPLRLRPGRPLPRGVQPPVMAFGDGHHRCPGAFLALAESDAFLRRLLSLPDLTIERPPTLNFNPLVEGYELREFLVRTGGAADAG